jgi:hypothetical protein
MACPHSSRPSDTSCLSSVSWESTIIGAAGLTDERNLAAHNQARRLVELLVFPVGVLCAQDVAQAVVLAKQERVHPVGRG